jgi:hypothetical protein
MSVTKTGDDGHTWTIYGSGDATGIIGQDLFIEPSSNGQAGFTTSANGTRTTTGFVLFGSTAMWVNPSTGSYESLYRAVPTGEQNVWMLMWDGNGTPEGDIPIALRTNAPAKFASQISGAVS